MGNHLRQPKVLVLLPSSIQINQMLEIVLACQIVVQLLAHLPQLQNRFFRHQILRQHLLFHQSPTHSQITYMDRHNNTTTMHICINSKQLHIKFNNKHLIHNNSNSSHNIRLNNLFSNNKLINQFNKINIINSISNMPKQQVHTVSIINNKGIHSSNNNNRRQHHQLDRHRVCQQEDID